jgi:long-chain acyl-CoA synthetase
MVLYDLVTKGRTEYPDRVAIHHKSGVMTYGELAIQVDRVACALSLRGVGPGDRVTVLLPNCPEFTVLYYAAASLGAVAVPANPLLKAAELIHIWGDASARLAFTIPQLVPAALEAKQSLPALDSVICLSADPVEGTVAYGAFVAEGSAGRPVVPVPEPDQPAVFIYTSGTTGKPKGAVLSHKNLLTNCAQIMAALQFAPDDNLLCVLPLFHSFAGTVCQNAALYAGASFTVLEQFVPARVVEAIVERRVTLLPGVPAMFGALLQFPTDQSPDLGSVRLCVSGGAPMPVALLQAFEARFATVIIEGDGPTECSPVTSVNPPDGVRKVGSIGLPVRGVDMRIFDNDDRELPDGEVGEIVVRGDNVMLGYHNQPQETADAMRNGWYHTGDLGRRDEDGYFFIVDRKKDMLIVGGLNVYPREVEEVLYTHAAVADAAVVGAADPLRGDQVVAVVVLKPGSDVGDRELMAYCRQRLANYKVPRRVIFREALPRGGTGKVLKRLLRKEMDLDGGAGP